MSKQQTFTEGRIFATPASSFVQILLCGLYFLWMHKKEKFTKF